MADKGRKNFSDKISESITPESQKSMWDKTTEDMSNKFDKAKGKMQPEDDKGAFQKIGDAFSGSNSNDKDY